MTYASVSVDSQVWESKQPGKRSKRGAVAELSKEEGREKRRLQNRISQRTLRTRRLEERNALMSSVHELSDQNQKLQEQLKQVVFQLNFWHNRELTKCNEKRAKIGSPPYESFDAMVRSDGETDRQIFSVPYVQVQNAFTMQVLDTERRSSEAHSGSGASDELLDDDSHDEGGDDNYSPITHGKRPYRHSAIKSKSSDSSLLLYPSTGQTNKRVSFSSSASSSRPSSSGSSANSAVSRARKPSTRGHVSSPPDLDPVTEESPYTITQPEKNLYHRYSQMTVASDDSYFALDAPSSSGYA
ncbi:hypothetical protein QFC24_003370 [Naganishia onofrii]|uniref:Uncharacterized protein n=1 Tax=Naganishia onofrii TaxID=1851511 RepID=A0ACC2XLS5_9TREE|nr:hypothetical protein QFC24_003370 [Naganishia onofrii]